MRSLILKTALIAIMVATAAWAKPTFEVPDETLQLVVVVSPDWNSSTARMQWFERPNSKTAWKPVTQPLPVNLGRTGLAWGKSELMREVGAPDVISPVKREGDGKAPAGLFSFLKAFGHPHPPRGYSDENLPFLQVKAEQCVDDVASPYYNQIVDPAKVGPKTWKSSEIMAIDLYELGLVVGHNCPGADPGMGSCIFYHLERGPSQSTAGCTSMSRRNLTNLLVWLRRDGHPMTVQLPLKEYKALGGGWPRI